MNCLGSSHIIQLLNQDSQTIQFHDPSILLKLFCLPTQITLYHPTFVAPNQTHPNFETDCAQRRIRRKEDELTRLCGWCLGGRSCGWGGKLRKQQLDRALEGEERRREGGRMTRQPGADGVGKQMPTRHHCMSVLIV